MKNSFNQLKSLFFYGFLGLLILGTQACSDSKDQNKKLETNALLNEQAFERSILNNKFTITDESGRPVRAQILIGDRKGNPFTDNWITTDETGVAVLPEAWTSSQSVTVDAPGFVRLTLLDQKPQSLKLQLRKLSSAQFELNGLSTGFQTKDFDNKVDFGLLLTAIEKQNLFTFSPEMVISPVTDKISAAGQSFDLPSNVTLPRQKESYFITITLDKPKYRMFYPVAGEKSLFMARGHFPMKEVVKGFQDKKEVFEMINLFSITGGQVKNVNLTSPKTTLDLNVAEMTFDKKMDFQAPAFSNDQVLLVVSAAEVKDSYIPSDVKKFTNGETLPLNIFSQQKNVLLGVMKNKNEFSREKVGADRFSAHLLRNLTGNMTFLPMIANPTVVNPQSFRFDVPQLKSGMKSLGMTVLISNKLADKFTLASYDGRAHQPKWEIRSLNWTSNFALPDLPTDSPASVFAASQKVQVSFVATTSSSVAQSWDEVIERATHITHASQDF